MAKPGEARRAVAAQIPEGRVGVSMDVTAAQVLIGVLRHVGGMPGRGTVTRPRDWAEDLLDALQSAVPQGDRLMEMPWRKVTEVHGAMFVDEPRKPGEAVPRRRYR